MALIAGRQTGQVRCVLCVCMCAFVCMCVCVGHQKFYRTHEQSLCNAFYNACSPLTIYNIYIFCWSRFRLNDVFCISARIATPVWVSGCVCVRVYRKFGQTDVTIERERQREGRGREKRKSSNKSLLRFAFRSIKFKHLLWLFCIFIIITSHAYGSSSSSCCHCCWYYCCCHCWAAAAAATRFFLWLAHISWLWFTRCSGLLAETSKRSSSSAATATTTQAEQVPSS